MGWAVTSGCMCMAWATCEHGLGHDAAVLPGRGASDGGSVPQQLGKACGAEDHGAQTARAACGVAAPTLLRSHAHEV